MTTTPELKWSTSRIDGEVKLHIIETGLASKPPETMHDVFFLKIFII